MTATSFSTFWHGEELSPYEIACLNSFLIKGHEVFVYSYNQALKLPGNIRICDARDLLSENHLNKFLVNGKPSIAHFTDYFRLLMFQETDHIWIDTDIFLLRNFDMDTSQNIIGMETKTSLCNAILKLQRGEKLEKLIQKIESMAGQDTAWGTTGPKALTSIYGDEIMEEAKPPKFFYPIFYEDFFKPFLPEYFEECEMLCKNAYTLHLWNHLIQGMGVFKHVGPPEGSYLHGLFKGTHFDAYYPESVMRVLVHNATVKIGHDAGIKKVAQHLGSAIKNSIRRRV